MSITRLQQARQMYALGQLVSKTMDGSRPGYRGDAAGHGTGDPGESDGPGGGGGGGNNDGPNSNRERGIMSRNKGPKGTTGNIGGFQDTGPDRSAVSQFSQYGKNLMNQNLKGPNLFSQIGSGIKNYVTSGGLLGMGIRGLGSLFSSLTGPKGPNPSEVGNLNMPGYNMLNIAGPVSRSPAREGGDGENKNLYATTNQYTIPTAVEEEGITTLINNPDFLQRFRVKNPYRQDKQGQLDPQIMEMISRLYT